MEENNATKNWSIAEAILISLGLGLLILVPVIYSSRPLATNVIPSIHKSNAAKHTHVFLVQP